MTNLNQLDELIYLCSNQDISVFSELSSRRQIKLNCNPGYILKFPQKLDSNHKKSFNYLYNLAANYLNLFHQNWQNKPDTRTYLSNTSLNKQLPQKMIALSEVIKALNLQLNDLDFNTVPFQFHIFVLGTIKHLLVWIYAEIEKIESNTHPATNAINRIYKDCFRIPVPTNPILVPLDQVGIPENAPLKSKDRNLLFEQIIKSPEYFMMMEKQMQHNGLLDEKNTLIPEYGNQKYLAAVLIQLLHKGYFNEFLLPGKIPIRSFRIRSFFEDRYKTSIMKQFNFWIKNPVAHMEFIQKYYWLENMRQCPKP